MKGTIFKRLFAIYGLTIIIGFGVLALLLLQLFNQYFIDSKRALMLEQGGRISQEIAASIYTGQVDQERLLADLEILDNLLNARIWIVDGQGRIVGVSGTGQASLLGETIDDGHIEQLKEGKAYFETGDFGGWLAERSLTAAYPIFAGNVYEGGLLIHAPLTEIGKTFREIYRMTVIAIVISCLLVYAVLYFQIRRISKPIREIGIAAQEIAGGQFQKRLTIRTGDEIEALGKSFNHMAESLEKIEDNRRRLIASITHDIRSPITSISGFAEGILDGTIPPERREDYLSKIMSESRRLMKITNNLLDLNNAQEGRVVPSPVGFELNELLRRTVLSFEPQITARALDVTLTLDSQSIPVFSDPDLISRILVNLIDNAVKFTPPGERIVVRADGSGDRAVVQVRNSGAPIEESQLALIWERFHKGDPSRGEDRNGFGLGLAIVRELAALLGERVDVRSLPGETVFTLTVRKAAPDQN